MEVFKPLMDRPMSRKLRMVLNGLVGTAVAGTAWLSGSIRSRADDDVKE